MVKEPSVFEPMRWSTVVPDRLIGQVLNFPDIIRVYVPLTSRDSRSYTVDSRYRKHWFLRVSFKTFPSFSIHSHSILLFLFYLITLEGRRGTTDEFATIPFHLVLFSAALVEVTKSIPVHSIILSSHLFFCLPLFICSFTVPCRIVFAKSEDLETWQNHLSMRF